MMVLLHFQVVSLSTLLVKNWSIVLVLFCSIQLKAGVKVELLGLTLDVQ